jgi:glycosyltransferase involved in cell wall biosynthesis
MSNDTNKKPRIAIFHHFFLGHCKGGGEKLILQMKDELQADLWVGAIELDAWGKDKENLDTFNQQLWNGTGKVQYLHQESNIPIWKYVKRQLFFLFSPKIKELANNYDIVIFSFGNIAFVPNRIKKINPNIKTLAYIHTPPRAFADQFEDKLKKIPHLLHPVVKIFKALVNRQLRKALQSIDIVICNSKNIKNRVKEFIKFDADGVIFPSVETTKFQYLGQGDFYHSHARLEPLKRIPLILEAFAKMPDKKLIITSSGPLKNWIETQIQERNLSNITYEGRVSDERRNWLMGNCIAGVFLPVQEDAGITQCEYMAAGKPIIGVNEGGLIETIVNEETGFLLPSNPTLDDVINGVNRMTPQLALSMKEKCLKQAKLFDSSIFYQKLNTYLSQLTTKEKS